MEGTCSLRQLCASPLHLSRKNQNELELYPEKSLWEHPSNYGKTGQKPIEATYFQQESPGEEEPRGSTKDFGLPLPGLSEMRTGRNIKAVTLKAKKKLFLENVETVENSKPNDSFKLSN